MARVLLANNNGNPNIGLFGVVTDTFVLLGKEVHTIDDKKVEETLQRKVHRMNIVGTGLLGVFCVWAHGRLLIPHITFESEKKELERLGIPYTVVTTELTCLGNNILVGLHKAFVNPDFSDEELHQLSDLLGMPVQRRTILGIEALGAIACICQDKALFHRDIPPGEVRELETELGVTITTGTLNMGNPYIKSACLVTEHGMVVGDASGGPELVNADEAFGFIEG